MFTFVSFSSRETEGGKIFRANCTNQSLSQMVEVFDKFPDARTTLEIVQLVKVHTNFVCKTRLKLITGSFFLILTPCLSLLLNVSVNSCVNLMRDERLSVGGGGYCIPWLPRYYKHTVILFQPPIPNHGSGRKCTLTSSVLLEQAVDMVKKHLKLSHVRLATAVGTQKGIIYRVTPPVLE